MLFNSQAFVIFFCIVYPVYLALQRRLVPQNIFLLCASFVFYAAWDPRFLILLLASAGIDFWAGLKIEASDDDRTRKRLLWLSIGCNLLILGFFKYFNFFTQGFSELLSWAGMKPDFFTLQVLLPVGISFYTFQSMSYGIDVYRRKLQPTRNLLAYFLMVAFFPHLVAGPIVRASRLLPQMLRLRCISADQINVGLYLVVWGFCKKIVIADNLAQIANPLFSNYQSHSGVNIAIGILAFTFQIYGDFSGYTDIARGLSKLMGFELDLNFNLPYFALSPSDFWRRWHISLSTWLRDYLYISLGGNRGTVWATYRNLLATMVLGGLWHGASWTFVIWGFYHGILLCAYKLVEDAAPALSRTAASLLKPARMAGMFVLTCIGWVIFRATTPHQIWYMLTHVGIGNRSYESVRDLYLLVLFCAPLVAVETIQYRLNDPIFITKCSVSMRVTFYTLALTSILLLAKRQQQEFIYFQF